MLIQPITLAPLCIEDALAQCAPLVSLQQRVHDSNARFGAVKPLLPPGLVPHISPGPVDPQGWSLLAANNAVAAKLKHLKPDLEAELRRQGWQFCEIRIKVSAP